MARTAVGDTSGALRQRRYVLHYQAAKFCFGFDDVVASDGVQCLKFRRGARI